MDAATCLALIKKNKKIKHPAINHTLYDLRILKNIALYDETIEITVTFPFPNIPIAEQIMNSICDPLKENGCHYAVKTTVMTPEEHQRFLQMEKQALIG